MHMPVLMRLVETLMSVDLKGLSLLTERDVAGTLQVCNRTLRTARQTGSIGFVKIGRNIRYTMADVADFVARSQVANDPQPLSNTINRSRPKTGKIVPFSARQKRV